MTLDILICCHSQSDFHDNLLRRALQSLVDQTYQDFNIIFVKDSCWPPTDEIINKFKNKLNITEVEHSKYGLAFAKNYGLNYCSSDYVGFLDADDIYFSKDKLQRQIDFIKENPEYDVVACQAVDIYNPGTDNEIIKDNCFAIGQYKEDWQIKERLRYENVICHASVLIRKSILERVGGYPEDKILKGKEDWGLWIRISSSGGKFYNMPFRGYGYSMGTSVER